MLPICAKWVKFSRILLPAEFERSLKAKFPCLDLSILSERARNISWGSPCKWMVTDYQFKPSGYMQVYRKKRASALAFDWRHKIHLGTRSKQVWCTGTVGTATVRYSIKVNAYREGAELGDLYEGVLVSGQPDPHRQYRGTHHLNNNQYIKSRKGWDLARLAERLLAGRQPRFDSRPGTLMEVFSAER